MERQRYCVYNQTSECFLSLGASLSEDALGYLGQMFLKRHAKVPDEGQWVLQPKPIHTLRLFSSRDLVILDAHHRVLEAIESWPSLRFIRLREDAASMLTLPVHTIYSSQTQPGHQLVICVPEEMKEKLRSTPGPEPGIAQPLQPHPAPVSAFRPQPARPSARAQRGISDESRLVAYDSKDTGLKMYSVREVSATGLFLATEERWPVGTQLSLTLQRMDGVSDSLLPAITVEMRVAGWGEDGIGLTFVRPGALEPLLTEMIGR
jgi:hypothetical protein